MLRSKDIFNISSMSEHNVKHKNQSVSVDKQE